MEITDELIEKVSECAFTNGGSKATYGQKWDEIVPQQRENVKEMVRDVLEAYKSVAEAQ